MIGRRAPLYFSRPRSAILLVGKASFRNGQFPHACTTTNVAVSYLEWMQNRPAYYWELEDVRRRLEKTMTREFQAVSQIGRGRNVDMRTAAYVHALTRLGEAIASKGTRTYFANNAR